MLTGRVRGKFLWGEPKAQAVRRFAREHDVDLPPSYGYANGDEDVPFLASTGTPARRSRRTGPCSTTAKLQGWPVLDMSASRCARACRSVLGTRRRARRSQRRPGRRRRRSACSAATGRPALNVGIPLACDAALAVAGVEAARHRRGEPLEGPAGDLHRQPPEQRSTR